MRFRWIPLILVACSLVRPALWAQAPLPNAGGGLNLVILEGEGAINNIKQRTSRETIVQVEDGNHKPVAGAVVVFLLPNDGPSGTFVSGSRTATVVTGNNGQAVMPGLQPNQVTGPYQVRVNASFGGRQASTTINQSNVAAAAAGSAASGAAHAGISGKAIGIIIGVVAAGAAGAALALSNSNKSTPSTPAPPATPTGSISVGSGAVFGPPH